MHRNVSRAGLFVAAGVISAAAWWGAAAVLICCAAELLRRRRAAARQGRELEDLKRSLQGCLESMPFPVFQADSARVIVRENAAFREWFTRAGRSTAGRHLRDVFGEGLFNQLRAASTRALDGEGGRLPLAVTDAGGGEHETELCLTPEKDCAGRYGFFGVFLPLQRAAASQRQESSVDELAVQRYLSEVEYSRKRIERQAEMLQSQSEELMAARDAALGATQAKSAFLANMSHELRTPLNGIVTMANLLCEEPLSPSQLEYAEIVKVSSDALLTIINDILDFSKIEAGKLTISPHPFHLRDTLRKMIALLQPQMQAKDVVFVEYIDPRIPDELVGDSGRLRQVLINLLGNAIKFTPPGGAVILAMFADEVRDTEAALSVHVADTGIGIAEDKLETIFGAFDQEDASTTRHYGGTGLGLSISRRLVELMNGRMQVRSKKGRGSNFYFTMQLGRQSDEQRRAESVKAAAADGVSAAAAAQSLKVLVADDNVMNQRVTSRLLALLGHQARTVGNGKEALALLDDAAADFDIVLMDCHMPEMDGYEATRAIRSREKERGGHLPIIGLTAATMKQELDQCIEAGMDDHLTKPVPKEMLQEKMLQLARASAGSRRVQP